MAQREASFLCGLIVGGFGWEVADLVGGPAMTRMRFFGKEVCIGPQRGMVIRIGANLGVMVGSVSG